MSLPRFPSCRRCCCCISTAFLVVVLLLILLVAIPLWRATEHESAYFDEIERLRTLDRNWRTLREIREALEPPPPWNKRLQPLIHDVAQLTSWGWLKQLQLNEDGTAEYPAQEHWIYLGGTAEGSPQGWKRWLNSISMYSMPNGSCVDSPHICHSYNSAFDKILEYYHTHRYKYTAHTSLSFADCDVSPLLCDAWNMDPVMLVHMQTKSPCRLEPDPRFRFICSVKWSFVALPLKKIPFTATMRTEKGSVVPVFPSAFEQMRVLLGFEGSVDALGLDEEGYTVEMIVDKGVKEKE